MGNEKLITIEDGLDTIQKRHLLELTKIMINGLNEQEFMEICMVYEKAKKRILT